MNTLNLGSDEMPEKKKKSNTRNLKIALGLAAVILVPTIGSTLAGQITVGGDGTVEFGQGVVTTAACDDSITVTPTSVLSATTFMLSTVTVSTIDATNCDGKYFTIKALDGTTPQQIGAASITLCKFLFDSAGSATAAAVSNADINNRGGACIPTGWDDNGFSFLAASSIATSLVDSITLESSE